MKRPVGPYHCVRHKIPLELRQFADFRYWACPFSDCEFVKPCKSVHRHGRARAASLAAIKAEVVRIGLNGTRQGLEFARKMFNAMPELKES